MLVVNAIHENWPLYDGPCRWLRNSRTETVKHHVLERRRLATANRSCVSIVVDTVKKFYHI